MEELNPESSVVYELLHHEIVSDTLLHSMSKLLEANNATLDGLMSVRVDGVREELALDQEQIKASMYKQETTDPGHKGDGSSSSRNVGHGRGGAATEVRANSSPRKFSPRHFHVADATKHSLFSLPMELPKFDDTNPRLWQN